MSDYDVIVIGSGAGGGTLVRHLAPSGKRILLLERGDWLPREPQNWLGRATSSSTTATSRRTRGTTSDGKAFQPQVHYCVGGATKLYGAALYRLREEDFGELRHHDGISPAWPIGYDEIEPYYTLAEQLYQVHGARGEDPTEPPASAPYPFPRGLARAAHPAALRRPRGRRPAPVPRAVRRACSTRRTCPTARCVRCATATASRASCTRSPTPRCSACGRRSSTTNVTLLTNAEAVRLQTDAAGHAGHRRRRRPRRRAGDATRRHRRRLVRRGEQRAGCCSRRPATAHPHGLANGSDQVGRNYMFHNSQAVLALSQRAQPDGVPEDARAQRLLLRERRPRVPDGQHPDGRQVRRRRCSAARSRCETRLAPSVDAATTSPRHAVDFWLSTEDLPRPENRVTLAPRRPDRASRYTSYQRRGQEAPLPAAEVDARAPRDAPRPPAAAPRLPQERDPGRRRRPPGGHVPVRQRSRRPRCSTPTAARTRSTTSTSSTRASSRASAR